MLTRSSPPDRLAEIDLSWGRRGSDPGAGSGTDCSTSQRCPNQRSANDTRRGSDCRAATSAITGRGAASRQQENEHKYARSKFRAHDVVLQNVRGTCSSSSLSLVFLRKTGVHLRCSDDVIARTLHY